MSLKIQIPNRKVKSCNFSLVLRGKRGFRYFGNYFQGFIIIILSIFLFFTPLTSQKNLKGFISRRSGKKIQYPKDIKWIEMKSVYKLMRNSSSFFNIRFAVSLIQKYFSVQIYIFFLALFSLMFKMFVCSGKWWFFGFWTYFYSFLF